MQSRFDDGSGRACMALFPDGHAGGLEPLHGRDNGKERVRPVYVGGCSDCTRWAVYIGSNKGYRNMRRPRCKNISWPINLPGVTGPAPFQHRTWPPPPNPEKSPCLCPRVPTTLFSPEQPTSTHDELFPLSPHVDIIHIFASHRSIALSREEASYLEFESTRLL